MRGQLTVASGRRPGAEIDFPGSWEALKREVLALVKSSLTPPHAASDQGAPPVPSHARETVEAVESLLAPAPELPPGAPTVPARKVRGIRGEQEEGCMHEVVACDPCLPREAWVTRCGWNFGGAKHVLYWDVLPTTCARCLRFSQTGGGALSRRAKKRPLEPSGTD